MKKAKTISHTILSPNPDKHCDNDNVFVSTQARMLSRAITPMGRGFKMIPMIVAIKMINRCHAFGNIASEIGKYHAIADKIIVNNKIRFCL